MSLRKNNWFHIRRDLQGSLRRLGVERVDLIQAHWPCERGTPLEETCDALNALVGEGLAGAWGLCNFAAQALGEGATHQAPYSLIRREIESNGVLTRCRETSTGLLAYETLGRGLLGGRFRTLLRFEENDHRKRDTRFWGSRFFQVAQAVDLLRQLGARHSISAAALARHWVATRPGVSATIVGARTLDQLMESTQPVPADAERMLERVAHFPTLRQS